MCDPPKFANRPGARHEVDLELLTLVALVAGAYLGSTPLAAQLSKTATEMKIDELKKRLDEGQKVLVVDVRTEEEVKSGTIPGAVNIPMADLRPAKQ